MQFSVKLKECPANSMLVSEAIGTIDDEIMMAFWHAIRPSIEIPDDAWLVQLSLNIEATRAIPLDQSE